jgi:hypothetical protein
MDDDRACHIHSQQFCELRLLGILGSSPLRRPPKFSNHAEPGRRQGAFGVGGRPFASYASACISERVWPHSTTTKKNPTNYLRLGEASKGEKARVEAAR